MDEIEQYVLARWISSPETIWRIFRFFATEIKPAIIHLQLHLENYQPVVFKKRANLQNVAKNRHFKKTLLTEFFHMNKTDEDAQRLNCTYSQFLDHFVWKSGQRYWKLREGEILLGQ